MKQLKILVVDDSITIRNFIVQLLEAENHQIIDAHNGKDALYKFKETSNLDLIISDVNMPIMGGIEFVTEVRKLNQEVPILMCTTESDADYKQKGIEAGANGWIVKPIRERQFVDIVRQITDE